jgi:hypothetical protein
VENLSEKKAESDITRQPPSGKCTASPVGVYKAQKFINNSDLRPVGVKQLLLETEF